MECGLTQLPPDLTSLARVQLLDLRGNDGLVNDDKAVLTAGLDHLTACRTIDLRTGYFTAPFR